MQKSNKPFLTEFMVDKSGYVIDKAIERAERKLTKLKQLRNQVSSIADPKQTNKKPEPVKANQL